MSYILEEETPETCNPGCNCQSITPAGIHDNESKRKWELIRVIRGQREEAVLPDNGWNDISCVDCDQLETFKGSLTDFAERLIQLGWAVDSVERNTTICKSCSNREDEKNWAAQYRSNSGGTLE